jgi:excisionase family DNA binding protein
MITKTDPTAVQPSQGCAEKTKNFVTRLLPNSETQAGPETRPAWDNPGTVRPCATTPTMEDLFVLYGGRNRLLQVAEVAEQLGVCAATVYRLCNRGELPHVRIVDSIRIRPADLAGFLAARLGR